MAVESGIDIEIPKPIEEIGKRVMEKGGELYIVGGWVRDRLMGTDSSDIDLATSLPPKDVKEAVGDLGQVFDLGEKFGSVGVRADRYHLEITTFRKDEYKPGSRHPKVTPANGIEEDLSRRDFTVNAIALAVTPRPGRLLDPFSGIGDIQRRIIRTPGPPGQLMAEDPLRLMRAVRFSAQLGYDIDPELAGVLKEKAELLDTISAERRRDELEKIIVSPNPDTGIRDLVETGLMEYVAHEISEMKAIAQPSPYHRADVLEHTLLTMKFLEPDPLLRRAALFHDVGKPLTMIVQPKIWFPEHEKVGESVTREIMRRLRYSRDDINRTVFLVRHHMRPIRYRGDWSDAAVRRMIRECTLVGDEGTTVPLDFIMELANADVLAGGLETVEQNIALLEELAGRVEEVRGEEDIERITSPLDGGELMSMFGRGPGAWISEVKNYLVELVVSGELNPDDREEASRFARDFLEDGPLPLE